MSAAERRPTGSRLDLLKTLGDNTRYAIYLELARSARPLSVAEVADTLGLHPNTVRPHLDRMRDVGLVEARADSRGAVGRPQILYSMAPDAPSLGLEPPVFGMLAGLLLGLAAEAGVDGEPAAEAGREQGRRLAHRLDPLRAADAGAGVDAAVTLLDDLGFDPAVVTDDGTATVAFGHCPIAELARTNPDLVCSLHRGLLEGFVDTVGGATVTEFHDLAHRTPCQACLVPS